VFNICNIINEIARKTAINKDNIKYLKIDSKIIDVQKEPSLACNAFKDFFSTIGINLSKNLNNIENTKTQLPKQMLTFFFLININII
jgi:hypothetical protein